MVKSLLCVCWQCFRGVRPCGNVLGSGCMKTQSSFLAASLWKTTGKDFFSEWLWLVCRDSEMTDFGVFIPKDTCGTDFHKCALKEGQAQFFCLSSQEK